MAGSLEDQMAESPRPPLPSELRGLAEFLDVDDRPTALLSRDAGTERIGKLYDLLSDVDGIQGLGRLYENTAFQRLALDDNYIARVVRDLHSQSKGRDIRPPERARSPESWKIVRVLDKYEALVFQGNIANGGPVQTQLDSAPAEEPKRILTANTGIPEEDADAFDSDSFTCGPIEANSPWMEYVRGFDWASTAIGPIHEWPGVLRGYVLHVMAHPLPRLLLWGDDRTIIYNEACIPLFASDHPGALGKSGSEAWCEMWKDIRPLVDASFQGKVQRLERLALTTRRAGFAEETYWDFVTLPMIEGKGHISGLFVELSEVTRSVTGERRRNTVLHIRQTIRAAETLQQLWTCFVEALEHAVVDVPFALLYAADELTSLDADGLPNSKCSSATLVGTVGISDAGKGFPKSFSLMDTAEAQPAIVQSCLKAWKSRTTTVIERGDGSLPPDLTTAVPGRGWGEQITTAAVHPITSLDGSTTLAVLVMGLNPRRPYEEEYKMFMHFLSDFLTRAASLISLPQEQRRAQKISDDMNNALAQQLRLITLQAERTEAKFTRMAAEAPTGVFAFDERGRPLYVNNAYLRILGQTQAEHANRNPCAVTWQDHIHPDDLERFQNTWYRAVEQRIPFTIEHRLKRPWTSVDKDSGQISGETWLLANAFPEVGPDGKIEKVMGWLIDISDRKFTSSLIKRKLEEALENKRQTENFIDMTSHEMRNPLSAILQSADSIVSALDHASEDLSTPNAVLSPAIVHEVLEAAQTVILCAQHQKRIVDDVLTMSKLDASLLIISPDKVDPPALLEKAVRMFEAEISRAGIVSKIVIEKTYEDLKVDHVVLDPSRLLQVVINLITNAIKFTQDAARKELTICLGASYDRPSGKHHGVDFIPTKHANRADSPLDDWGNGEDLYLQIAVTDTGHGLSEEDIRRLFQRFSQANPKTYSKYGGNGLGLFISRELCELQGGQIGVSSKDGKTTFTFFVRAKRWVPDNRTSHTHRPELPRFTSTSASPMIYSRRGSVVPQSPIGSSNSLSRVSSNHLSRTISMREEPEVMAGAENKTPLSLSRQSTRSFGGQMVGEKLHVLVVEDNLINQKVMAQQLRRAGCIVHVANHGQECLTFVEKSIFCKATTELSVILLDLEMPIMDGLTCIKHIRQRQTSGEISMHIPVIAVTANARSEQIALSIEAGMDQVVTKPFRIPELLPQMHSLVQEVSGRRNTV